jgi:hypothetical protein
MISSNMHPCIFCRNYSIDCAYGWALAICEDCMPHAQNIASGKYVLRRLFEPPQHLEYNKFSIQNPDDGETWHVHRCRFDRNPRVRSHKEISGKDKSTKAYKEATGHCEHPAFWVGSNGAMVCSRHKDGYVTFANHFCEVPDYIGGSDEYTRYCANKATTTIDGLRVCEEHTPSIGPFTVDEEFDFASHFTTPSTEEEQP